MTTEDLDTRKIVQRSNVSDRIAHEAFWLRTERVALASCSSRWSTSRAIGSSAPVISALLLMLPEMEETR